MTQDNDDVREVREILAAGRQQRGHVLHAHKAFWDRLKCALSQPRKTPRAEILVRVGDLLTLLDATHAIADDYVRALTHNVVLAEKLSSAQQSAKTLKQQRGNVIAQLNEVRDQYEALKRRLDGRESRE